MASVRPFRGVRYGGARLDRAVCPPYDVIAPRLAAELRRLPRNAIHLELPSGDGGRYRRAARLWRRWLRRRARTGLLASLDLRRSGPRWVRRHEKTLAKPKEDRLRLLSALKANTSPVFMLFSDAGGTVRAVLRPIRTVPPAASGVSPDGSRFKLWHVRDPALLRRLERAFSAKALLIADGHHRFEVARAYFRRHPAAPASGLLVYLCAEEDPGLLVLPTHRVIAPGAGVRRRALDACRLTPQSTLSALLKALAAHRSPYAFGVFQPVSGFRLAVPRSAAGARSGLSVEWLAKNVTAGVDPQDISYTHDAGEAVRLARERRGAALLVKPASVARIRKAVERVGLLPQKSTYFYPKVATGLVFKALC